MLSGKAPYEGDNVMEVLHKKANEPPPPLGELRPGLPPAMMGLVERAMARNPEERPQSMADMAYEIRAIENALLTTPPPVVVPPTSSSSRDDAQGSLQAVLPEPSQTRVVRPFVNRRPLYIAAGITVALFGFLGFLLFGRSSDSKPESRSAPTVAPPPAPLPPPPPPALDAATEAAPVAAEPTSELGESGRREPSGRPVRTPATTAKELEESMQQAQQLLHAQRYEEARAAFGRLLTVKSAKGAAAAGLAKIAFQEENYRLAAERARESARTGGGVEARLLMGDAYFKLQKYDEAKKAYNEALKLDPNNRAAGQGLRLVEGQEEAPK
jgi:tetratricopeptide (TPR) repeat protein